MVRKVRVGKTCFAMFPALGTLKQHVAHGLPVFTTPSYLNVRPFTILPKKKNTDVNQYHCLFTII